MYRIPPRRAKPRTRKDNGDLPQHRAFVRRGKVCTVPGCQNQNIEAAHLRINLPPGEHGGTSFRPHDKWCYPLCHDHHAQQHHGPAGVGERTFVQWLWDTFKIDALEVCKAYWRDSPVRKRLEAATRA